MNYNYTLMKIDEENVLENNGSPRATVVTDDERTFFRITIPCHEAAGNIIADIAHKDGTLKASKRSALKSALETAPESGLKSGLESGLQAALESALYTAPKSALKIIQIANYFNVDEKELLTLWVADKVLDAVEGEEELKLDAIKVAQSSITL